jgi:AraC family transcriptional regulator
MDELQRPRTMNPVTAPGFSCHLTVYPAGSVDPPHAHPNARFVFVLHGSFADHTERLKRSCNPFVVIFRPAGERHSDVYGPERVVCASADIDQSWLDRLSRYGLELSDPTSNRSPFLSNIAARLDTELRAPDVASPLALDALLSETAIELSRVRSHGSDRQPPPWLQRAHALIGDEYARPLSLADIGAACGVHPAHLARVFRRFDRCTVADYLRRTRIEAASRQLSSTTRSIADVAVAVGFGDQSHLSKHFKRAIGVSPGRYRRLTGGR